MSKQSKLEREIADQDRRMIAEDAAIKYLAKNFSPEVAAAISTTVEMLLAIRWQEELLSCDPNDRRRAFLIGEDAMREITRAFTEIPRGVSDPRGEKHAFDLVQDLPLDWAWNVMRLVRTYLVHEWRMSIYRQTGDGLPWIAKRNVGAA
jgi:hypothetical protein